MNIFSSNPQVVDGGGRAVSGHLELGFQDRGDGRTVLARQSFRAPMHVGKPHEDEGTLVLQLVNPTAGFFDGDRLVIDVSVETGARASLSTPSAARVHRARESGNPAVVTQHLKVAAGAFLEWIPDAFIPHAGSCYRQETRIELEPGAALLYFDWITPGRVARGEIFAYTELRWHTDLSVGGQLISRERHTLNPANHSLAALRRRFPAAHFLSVHCAGIADEAWPGDQLDALASPAVYAGHGRLPCGARVARALCADSLSARATLARWRELLYQASGRAAPALGKW